MSMIDDFKADLVSAYHRVFINIARNGIQFRAYMYDTRGEWICTFALSRDNDKFDRFNFYLYDYDERFELDSTPICGGGAPYGRLDVFKMHEDCEHECAWMVKSSDDLDDDAPNFYDFLNGLDFSYHIEPYDPYDPEARIAPRLRRFKR